MTSASNITKLMLTFVTLTKVSLFLYNVHRDGKGSKVQGSRFKSFICHILIQDAQWNVFV